MSLAAAAKDGSVEKIKIMRRVYQNRMAFSRSKREQRTALEVFLGRKRCFYFTLEQL